MSRIVVVGGDGIIGSALTAALQRAGETVVATTRRPDDSGPDRPLVDLSAPHALPDLSGDVAFLCAADASIARCEADPEGTRAINVTAPLELARRFAEAGTFVCLLSTTAVFDGERPDYSPNDTPTPKNRYGEQKAELEAAIRSLSPRGSCIVRLGKVVSRNSSPFSGWLGALRSGSGIDAYRDAVVAPVSLGSSIALLLAVAARRPPEIVHYTSSNQITYLEAARQIALQIGKGADAVRARRHPKDAFFPRYATLDCAGTAALGTAVPLAEEALKTLGA